MTFIETIPEEAASGDVAGYYDADLKDFGCVRNLTAAFSHAPEVLAAWQQLNGADELRAIMADHRDAGLDAADVAVMDLADKVAADATSVTQADIDRLKEHGLSDEDVFDVV